VPVEFSLGLARRYGWELDVLPAVGHVPMMEVPELFCQTALKWLRSVDGAQPSSARAGGL